MVVGRWSSVVGRSSPVDREQLLTAARQDRGLDRRRQLSEAHVSGHSSTRSRARRRHVGKGRPKGRPLHDASPFRASARSGASFFSAAAPSRSMGGSSISADRFFAILARAMPCRRLRRGMRCGGMRGFTWRSSSTASTASIRDSISSCATTAPSTRSGAWPHDFLWERATDRLPLFLLARWRLPPARRARQLRSGDRRRRLLQPRDDRRVRREPRRVWSGVLSSTCSGESGSSARCCASPPKPTARALCPVSAASSTTQSTTCSVSSITFQLAVSLHDRHPVEDTRPDDRARLWVGERAALKECATARR